MSIDTSELLPFKGTLVCFSGEQVQVLGNLPIMTIFRSGSNTKGIRVRYLIVNASSPYNIIIGRLTLNSLEAVISILYLTMKYPLEGRQVGMIKGYQGLSRKCFKDILKLKNKKLHDHPMTESTLKVNLVDLDSREDPVKDSLTPIRELKRYNLVLEIFRSHR